MLQPRLVCVGRVIARANVQILNLSAGETLQLVHALDLLPTCGTALHCMDSSASFSQGWDR